MPPATPTTTGTTLQRALARFHHLLPRPRQRPQHRPQNPTSLHHKAQARTFSTPPPPPPPPAPRSADPRLTRLQARLPAFLRGYTAPLLAAPVTHISAFVVLHELTAVVPLFGLAGLFHYTQWLPPFFSEGRWISEGVGRFGRWFKKRGWLGEGVVLDGVDGDGDGGEEGGLGADARTMGKREVWWQRGEGGVRVVVEFATAYAITKALMPLRLILSVWATPWFARTAVIPTIKLFKSVFWRSKKAKAASAAAAASTNSSPAAGTGAVGGGVVGKVVLSKGSPFK